MAVFHLVLPLSIQSTVALSPTIVLPPTQCLTVPRRGIQQHYVVLYDTAGRIQAVFDNWNSLQIEHTINAASTHTLEVWNDNAAKFVLDGFVEVWWRFEDTWYLEYGGFHRTPHEHITELDKDLFTSYGVGYVDLLHRRSIGYLGRIAQTVKGGPGETVIKQFVNENAGPAANSKIRLRNGTTPGLNIEPDSGRGLTWFGERSEKNLLDVIQEIAAATNVDFDVVRLDGPNFEFRAYYPRRGVDKHLSLAFATQLGNMIGPHFTTSRTEEATVVLALGDGEGTARRRLTAVSPAAADSPWNTIEVVEDARDEKTLNGLTTRANSRLREVAARESFTFRVQQTLASLYRRDYAVGDVVSVRFKDIERYKKINRATLLVPNDGDVQVTLEFSEASVVIDTPAPPPAPPTPVVLNLNTILRTESAVGFIHTYTPPSTGGGTPLPASNEWVITAVSSNTRGVSDYLNTRHIHDPSNSLRWGDAGSGYGYQGDIDKELGVTIAGDRGANCSQLFYLPRSATRNLIPTQGTQGHHYDQLKCLETETRNNDEADHAAPDWNECAHSYNTVLLRRAESAGRFIFEVQHDYGPRIGYTGVGSDGPVLRITRRYTYYPSPLRFVVIHSRFQVIQSGFMSEFLDRWNINGGPPYTFQKTSGPETGTYVWGGNYATDRDWVTFFTDGFNRSTGATDPNGMLEWRERLDVAGVGGATTTDVKNISAYKRDNMVDDDGRTFPVNDQNWAGMLVDSVNLNDPDILMLLPYTNAGQPGVVTPVDGNSFRSWQRFVVTTVGANPLSESPLNDFYVEGAVYKYSWQKTQQISGGELLETHGGSAGQWPKRGYYDVAMPEWNTQNIFFFGDGVWSRSTKDGQSFYDAKVKYGAVQTRSTSNCTPSFDRAEWMDTYTVSGTGDVWAVWQRERNNQGGLSLDYRTPLLFKGFTPGNEPTDVQCEDAAGNPKPIAKFYDPVAHELLVALNFPQDVNGAQAGGTASQYRITVSRQ